MTRYTAPVITFFICTVFFCLSSSAQQPRQQENDPTKILLKDYRPISIYQVPQTKVSKARHPIIDMHSHAYAKTEAEVDQWVQTMDAVGVERTMVLTSAVGTKFDEIVARFKKYPQRFSLWCGFDFTGYDRPGYGPAAVTQLEKCHASGGVGVGELGDKGKGLIYGDPKAYGMHIDDPRMDALLEACARLKMPVSVHVAEPIWMYRPMDATNDGLMNAYQWRLDNQPGIVGHRGMIETLERALRKHPRTTFIACHFANSCYDLTILGALFERYPNLYADTSARYAETATIPRYMFKFYEKYQDRLLYGTDMGMGKAMYATTFRILESEDEHFYDFDLFTYHWPLSGFGLSDSVLQKLYRGNALKILSKVD